MSILSDLFLCFAKIGLFTFGGGYAMISLIEDNCVNQKKWITYDEMMNVTVIAESTPGPIAINCATYVGYKKAGLPGAVAATFGIVAPSFVVIYLISMFLDNFMEITIILKALWGIRIAVGILILNAAFNMIKKMKKKFLPVGIMLSACAIMLTINIFSVRFSSVSLMLIASVFSLVLFVAQETVKGDKGK